MFKIPMFNTCDGASAPTSLTLQKKYPRILLEDRVGGTARVTCHVF